MRKLEYFVSQNFVFCLSFIILLAIYLVFEFLISKKNQRSLSIQEAVSAVNKNKGIYLDTRSVKEYKKAHIIGADNIVFTNIETKSYSLVKNKGKPIIIYGDKSDKAVSIMRKKGFTQTYSLKGGLDAWLKASYPIKSENK